MSSQAPTAIGDEADAEIFRIYRERLDEIRRHAANGEAEACLARTFDLWMFMNRFRNCDLGNYFDEDLHAAIASLNPRRFDTAHLLKPKSEFRIAFIVTNLVDTGGASVPHRFMLERPSDGAVRFRQYVLDSNLRDRTDYEETESYRYLEDNVDLEEFTHVPAGMSWIEKGEFIERWLYEREIDFVVAAPCPATLYAIASRPALIHGILDQNCYCFTLGPGAGDVTFLVTTDQVFKYRFSPPDVERQIKVVMLPLHAGNYIEDAVPLERAAIGVPEDAVVSGSTNLWKTCFGDTEILLEGIAALIRRFPHYHHVFAGTPRCLDNLEFFLNRNPDLRGNIHFIGTVRNIYRFLKAVDFWINSFPTSGGSDIECAMVGKPTIEFLANRNLNLHGAEFLRSRECDVVSLDEFVELGARFITDPAYRDDLGEFLKAKISREFDKERIVADKIYGTFLRAFDEKLGDAPALPGLDLARTMAYEKCIGLYNAHGRRNWDAERRWTWLEVCRAEYPEKPFAWIKAIEEAMRTDDAGRLDGLVAALDGDLLKDLRIHVMLALAFDRFGDTERAIEHALEASGLAIYDETARRVAARLLIKAGRGDEAAALCPDAGDIAALPADEPPIYYDY